MIPAIDSQELDSFVPWMNEDCDSCLSEMNASSNRNRDQISVFKMWMKQKMSAFEELKMHFSIYYLIMHSSIYKRQIQKTTKNLDI